MNILYLCADRGIPVQGDKGAAVHIRMMIAAFARAGHAVTLLAPRIDGEQAIAGDVTHVPLPKSDKSLSDEARKEAQCLAYNEVLYTAALDLLQTTGFDLIYERYSLWSDVGARLKQATGLPFVLEVNAPLREEAGTYRSLINDQEAAEIEQNQFRSADIVSVVSKPLAKYVRQQGASEKAVQVLPNAVDPMRFHPAVRGRRLEIGKEKKIIGFVGRIRPWHDIETVLKAVSILQEQDPDYHLLLVGRGSETLEIPSHLTDAVTCVGAVPHAEIPSYIAAMDVAVSPHINSGESWFSPLKLFEYLACGVPVISAEIGQSATVITDHDIGWLYQPENAPDLAKTIQTVFAHNDLAKEKAWRGADLILHQFTWDQNAETVITVTGIQPSVSTNADSDPTLPLFDPKLRQRLYRATRKDLALPLLPSKLRNRWQTIERIDVLKHKVGRRAVLGYQANTGERVIGKVFKDDRAERLDQIQKFLWNAGFDDLAEDRIMVAAGLGHAPKMRMQLQRFVPGVTLSEYSVDHDIATVMPRVARGLAKLHAVTVPDTVPFAMKRWTYNEELANSRKFFGELKQLCPDQIDTIFPLYENLVVSALDLPQGIPFAPLHRDFYYSQVMINDADTYLIDFDLFTWGDPALDCANFVAHNHLLSLLRGKGWDGFNRASDLFLSHYTRHADHNLIGFWKRFDWYKSATILRLLTVVQTRPALETHFDLVLHHALNAEPSKPLVSV